MELLSQLKIYLQIRRDGETPQELLQIVEGAGIDNLGVTIDVGHAYITAQQYGFNIKEYFDILKDYSLICVLRFF